MTIRGALAEDHALLRQGLERLLAGAPDIELVGSAANVDDLGELIERTDPDVVVTDIRMPPSNTDVGIQIAAQLRRDRPGCGVVV
ncbi:MAG: response regulator transcription factor, partial [Ilumatobacteraceae bacterium]